MREREQLCTYFVAKFLPLLQEAKDIGDEFLALEKFVNLNYLVSSHPVQKRLCCFHQDAAALVAHPDQCRRICTVCPVTLKPCMSRL